MTTTYKVDTQEISSARKSVRSTRLEGLSPGVALSSVQQIPWFSMSRDSSCLISASIWGGII